MSTNRLKFILAISALLLPLLCSGQVNVFTKKHRISDFSAKTTKVVLTGEDAFDLCLRSEVSSRWRISPYEFITVAEFENLKSSPKYYFLHCFKDSSGLMEMTLTKGGGKGGFSSMDSKMDVVKVPVDIRYLAVVLDIVQNYVEDARVSDTKCLFGLKAYNGTLHKARRKKLFFASHEDEYFTDSLLYNSAPCLLGFSIAPEKAAPKAMVALFIASTDTHELYFYKKRKFTVEAERLFSSKERRDVDREHGFVQ